MLLLGACCYPAIGLDTCFHPRLQSTLGFLHTHCNDFSELLFGTTAAASSKQLKRGVKEVVKAIRKGQKGYISVDSILLLLSHLANQDENIILTLSAFFCTTVHSEENMRDLLSIYFFSASLH